MARRSSRWRWLGAIALVLGSAAWLLGMLRPVSNAKPIDEAQYALPPIEFGNVRAGQTLRATVVWTNPSTAQLSILRTTTDCGCLTVAFREHVVPSNGILTLDCELRPPGDPGVLEVPFTVFLSDGHALRGTVVARILAPPDVTRNAVVSIAPGASTWSSVVMIRLPWEPGAAEILPESLNPEVSVTLGPHQWTGADCEIAATLSGPVHAGWGAPLAHAADDWREGVVFEVRHPEVTVRLRTQITLVRADVFSVSPRILVMVAGELGRLTLQDSLTSEYEELSALTDPPGSAILQLIGRDQCIVTSSLDSAERFDVLLFRGSRSTRVPVLVLPRSP